MYKMYYILRDWIVKQRIIAGQTGRTLTIGWSNQRKDWQHLK